MPSIVLALLYRYILDVYIVKTIEDNETTTKLLRTCEESYDRDVGVEMSKLIGQHDKSIPMREMYISIGIVRKIHGHLCGRVRAHMHAYKKPLVYNCSMCNLNWDGWKTRNPLRSFFSHSSAEFFFSPLSVVNLLHLYFTVYTQ